MGVFHTKRRTGWCALLCAVCIILALCSSPVSVNAAGQGKLHGSGGSAERGEDITVTFSISENPGIWGMKGSVSYDSSVMTLKSVSAGSVFTASEILMGEDLKQNPYVFLVTANTIGDNTKNGSLIKLTFTIKDTAPFAKYAVKIGVSQVINADGSDVSLSTSGASVTVAECLHRNTYLKDEVKATEESEGYSGDTYCKKCGILVKKGKTVPKVVNTCKHANQSRTVVEEASCTADGLALITCDDCGKEISQEKIPAAGHVEGALTNWKGATTTEEGYSGDIFCEVCNKRLEEGTVIPKIQILVFNMALETEDTYLRDSQTSLVFVSDADPATFNRVEIDGAVLEEQNYILTGEKTKITLKPEYLETLIDGKHTITVVSDAGTASAQFFVTVPQEEPVEEPEENTWDVRDTVMLIITIVAVLAAAGSIAYTLVTEAKRNRKGRHSSNEEK